MTRKRFFQAQHVLFTGSPVELADIDLDSGKPRVIRILPTARKHNPGAPVEPGPPHTSSDPRFGIECRLTEHLGPARLTRSFVVPWAGAVIATAATRLRLSATLVTPFPETCAIQAALHDGLPVATLSPASIHMNTDASPAVIDIPEFSTAVTLCGYSHPESLDAVVEQIDSVGGVCCSARVQLAPFSDRAEGRLTLHPAADRLRVFEFVAGKGNPLPSHATFHQTI